MPNLRVFLGNSPWLRPGAFGVRAGSRWPHFEKSGTPYMPFPFFLGYASSLLRKNDFETCAVDGIAEGISEELFLDRISTFRPDVIVLEISTASLDVDTSLVGKLRTILGRQFPIVWCGAHSWTTEDENILRQVAHVDFFIGGEYEHTLFELCQKISKGDTQYGEVAGLIWRDKSGEPVTNPKRPLIQNLDEFPWPDRDSFPMNKYMEAAGALPWPNLQMWASRGCPFQCNFCVWPQFMYNGRNYRIRTPKDMLDEIEYALERYDMKSVYFDDDTFNIGKKRINEISDEFIKRNLGITWGAMSRADTFDGPTFEKMVKSGFRFIKFGVESGEQTIVDRMEKALDLEKVKQSMKWAKELGVNTHLTFSFGHIGETKETAEKTINLALELSPDTLQFSIITPFPGSELYRDLKELGHLSTDNLSKYDGYTSAVISTKDLSSKQLEEILSEANARWQRHVLWRAVRHADLKPIYWGLKFPRRALQRVREMFG